ncbi:hypothetical protein B0J11DRAFT_518573 [Dendryphion nanum]|uniref:DUF1772-domain-containing protein n=1 Tax=Dendryphion nanum TaxID=256645 RepID=A0A9P9EA88_9PLEO|nr:hypothetical protein B0J11DRAFT_518573 [Dendryphion nanum]
MSFYSEKPPVLLRSAQAVGVLASAIVFGQNAFISFGAVPAVMYAPAPLAVRQWIKLYDVGHYIGPAGAILGALSSAYVASQQKTSSLAFKLNVAASVFAIGILPFTFAFIVPVNKKLFAKEKLIGAAALEDKAVEAGVAREETVHALLDKWATLNFVRALISGVSAGLAAWTAVDKLEGIVINAALKSGANRLG